MLRSLAQRQRYTLRDVQTLADMLDLRYVDRRQQPDTAELGKGLALL